MSRIRAARFLAAAGLSALASLAAGHASATTPAAPVPGLYNLYQVTTSVSGACNGDTVGSTTTQTLDFKGPGVAGSQIWSTGEGSGTSGLFAGIQEIVMPVTPATNGATTTGSFTRITYPASKKATGTVTLTFTYATANLFLATATVVNGSGSTLCTEGYSFAATRTGK